MSLYPFTDYPCCKEKERESRRSYHTAFMVAYWLVAGIPSLCMIAFHDLLFPYPWNPLDFGIMVLPQFWGVPLLVAWRETRSSLE